MKTVALLSFFMSFSAMANHFLCYTRREAPVPVRSFLIENMDQHQSNGARIKKLDAFQTNLKRDRETTEITFEDGRISSYLVMLPTQLIQNVLENRQRSLPMVLRYKMVIDGGPGTESVEGIIRMTCQKTQLTRSYYQY